MTRLRIEYTKKYDRFLTLLANRNTDDDHIKSLESSIKSYGISQPIQVDRDFNIIDGQNRLKALINLKLSVPFIRFKDISGDKTIETIKEINTKRKNWDYFDFAKSYANSNNKYKKSYERFLDLRDSLNVSAFTIFEHNKFFGLKAEVSMKKGKKGNSERVSINGKWNLYKPSSFKNGEFILNQESYDKMIAYFDKFIESNMPLKAWRRTYFLRSMSYLMENNSKMSIDYFLNQYTKYGKRKSVWSDEVYTEYDHTKNIVSLYNYKTSKSKKIDYAFK
tara:strand:- start:50 stop:883 length:834 start_codon:yes stop_codon:yes gene_type:complete